MFYELLTPILCSELSNGIEEDRSDGSAAGFMRIALEMLSVGAVTFLLRFLAALVKEVKSKPASAVIYFVKVKPPRQHGELVQMTVQTPTRRVSAKTGQRMAL